MTKAAVLPTHTAFYPHLKRYPDSKTDNVRGFSAKFCIHSTLHYKYMDFTKFVVHCG